ncbi:hypothetical protein GCM10027456_48350 [Kineosporia babensis]
MSATQDRSARSAPPCAYPTARPPGQGWVWTMLTGAGLQYAFVPWTFIPCSGGIDKVRRIQGVCRRQPIAGEVEMRERGSTTQ